MRLPGILALLCFLPICPTGWGAVLSLGMPVVSPGQASIALLSFASEGEPISGVQFDIEWDAPLAIASAAGSQIRASSKLLYTAAPSSHVQRFVITGLNTERISDGDLLRCFLSISAAAPAGKTEVRLT